MVSVGSDLAEFGTAIYRSAEICQYFTDFTDASSVEDTQLAWASIGLKESHIMPTITNNNTNII